MNPMMQMMRMMPGMGGNMPMNPMAMMGGQGKRPTLDRAKMRQYMGSIDDVQLNNLAAQAKQQGISDAEIEAGLSFLRKMRK